jgi:hypothetical protein
MSTMETAFHGRSQSICEQRPQTDKKIDVAGRLKAMW